MPDDTKHGANCTEFEALLSDAIEGLLTGATKDSFDAHRRTCAVCGPLFADAAAGREFLLSLEPVEPPAYLVHNILVATSGVLSTRTVTAGVASATPRGERLREWWDSWFTPVTAFVRQPRFAMSFGMIFFSFSLALSAAGFKASDVAKIDLRPAAVREIVLKASTIARHTSADECAGLADPEELAESWDAIFLLTYVTPSPAVAEVNAIATPSPASRR